MSSAPRYAAWAYHELGEVRRRRGDRAGDSAGAQRAIRRAAADEGLLSREGLALVLPAQITIEIAAGDLDAARGALAALEARVEASGSSAFAAAAARLELECAQSAFDRIGAVRESTRITALLTKPADARAVRTFMFTDIVDSTKLVELLGDEAWESLLAWHDRTLRACFAAHNGEEVKHEGDGFFVAFADAASALECAIATQRTLDEHRRDHGFALRIRIGIHAAEVTEREGDYGGKGVHVAARLAGAARAGEIVASRETAAEVGDGVVSSAPRRLELKGLGAPVEVVSVDWR